MRDSPSEETCSLLILPPSLSLSLSHTSLKLSKSQRKDETEKPKLLLARQNRIYMKAITKNGQSLSLITFMQSSLLTSFRDRRCTVTTHSQPLDPHRIIRQSTSTCQTGQTKPLLLLLDLPTCNLSTLQYMRTAQIPSPKPRRLWALGFVSSCQRTFVFCYVDG